MFERQHIHDKFIIVSGTPTFTQFPTGTAMLVRFGALDANYAPFYIGSIQDSNAIYEISAGENDDWFNPEKDNINTYGYKNASGSHDKLIVWLQN